MRSWWHTYGEKSHTLETALTSYSTTWWTKLHMVWHGHYGLCWWHHVLGFGGDGGVFLPFGHHINLWSEMDLFHLDFTLDDETSPFEAWLHETFGLMMAYLHVFSFVEDIWGVRPTCIMNCYHFSLLCRVASYKWGWH